MEQRKARKAPQMGLSTTPSSLNKTLSIYQTHAPIYLYPKEHYNYDVEKFKLVSDYQPSGDQPQAIDKLVERVEAGARHQVLLGVTGSGKTFTMANVIERVQRPTLIISHNKTLAAQLYAEFKTLFPENEVHFFVSYYDYYQPEAYLPATDTFIEKDSSINEEIDRLRLLATNALFRPQRCHHRCQRLLHLRPWLSRGLLRHAPLSRRGPAYGEISCHQ